MCCVHLAQRHKYKSINLVELKRVTKFLLSHEGYQRSSCRQGLVPTSYERKTPYTNQMELLNPNLISDFLEFKEIKMLKQITLKFCLTETLWSGIQSIINKKSKMIVFSLSWKKRNKPI